MYSANLLQIVQRFRRIFTCKSKKKKTTGFILIGTGAGLVIAGVVDAASTGEYTGLIPILVGTIVMLTSVPYFNAAANYKRKANSITFTRQNLMIATRGGRLSVLSRIKFQYQS